MVDKFLHTANDDAKLIFIRINYDNLDVNFIKKT
jgi:hypothetical protein